ncbi:lysophospholipid acyltransferase 7-like isoform X1 [Choristoneura fumiferana]|uniref:lysophospholipid acyltransferase 7-like isoform X1 n=1 Tax=Choristoneura fumiferana TaxID=7141 RepID=UPI003D154D3E
MFEDILYYSSLLGCVILGSYYKKIDDVVAKRNYGAGLGILVTCFICGHYVFHSVFLVWGNVVAIKCCDMRTKTDLNSGAANDDEEAMKLKPSASDIISYAYFFIGIHKGPYYTWKTFNEHFNTPFRSLGDCRVITEQKLKKAFLCSVGYWMLQMNFPLEVYNDRDFYDNYGSDYRFISNMPRLIMYFFKYQIIMMLCTSICTETGFGVYPAKCMPTPGHGPTTEFSLLKMAAGSPEVALQQEYNFAMLKCFDNQKLVMGPKMKDTVRGWDMPTRYWFWTYTYKNMVKSNSTVRSAVSFMAWTIWAGSSKKEVIVALTLWVYIHLETEYAAMYDAGSLKGAWAIGFTIMRILCLIYLTPCFVIADADQAINYYRSIYWAYHILLIVLTVVAAALYKAGHQPRMSSSGGKPFPPRPKEILDAGKVPSSANIVGAAKDIAKNMAAPGAAMNKAVNATESTIANAASQSSNKNSGPTKSGTDKAGGTDKPSGTDKPDGTGRTNRPDNPGGPSTSLNAERKN